MKNQKIVKIVKRERLKSSHRKERRYTGGYHLVVSEKGKISTIADLRFYETDARVYACFWLHDVKLGHASGSGYAGGYGYHMHSAAAAEAISNAGIELKNNIGGVGNEAIVSALEAIAEYAGYKTYSVIESCG